MGHENLLLLSSCTRSQLARGCSQVRIHCALNSVASLASLAIPHKTDKSCVCLSASVCVCAKAKVRRDGVMATMSNTQDIKIIRYKEKATATTTMAEKCMWVWPARTECVCVCVCRVFECACMWASRNSHIVFNMHKLHTHFRFVLFSSAAQATWRQLGYAVPIGECAALEKSLWAEQLELIWDGGRLEGMWVTQGCAWKLKAAMCLSELLI